MTTKDIIAKLPKKERYDYFLIWGHGSQYEEQIMDILRKQKDLEILLVTYHKTGSINELIDVIYDHDYAPLEHLKAKSKYLEQVSTDAIFIFVKNINPEEAYVGEGDYRHVECLKIKRIKEEIRNQFNPREGEKRTEHHVVHASDNEIQTHYALIYLGYTQGLKYFLYKPNSVLNLPVHLAPFTKFELRKVSMENIYCTIIVKTPNGFEKEIVKITESPHYKAISGDKKFYDQYRQEFKETIGTIDNHFWDKFVKLKSMKYLGEGNSTDYIIVDELKEDKYVIRDGVHRASVLQQQGVANLIVAKISND